MCAKMFTLEEIYFAAKEAKERNDKVEYRKLMRVYYRKRKELT